MSNVLYITNHDPWGIGGGSFASAMFFRTFRKIFLDDNIDLCVADNCRIPSDIKNINIIPVPKRWIFSQLNSVFTGELNRYKNIGIQLLKSKHYDYVILDHNSLGILVDYIPASSKSIVIHHNYEPDFYRDNTKSILKRILFLPRVKQWERTAYKNCFINIFLTTDDLEQFHEIYGEANGNNIVTGLIEEKDTHITPLSSINTDPVRIVITGSLDNVQNVDGITYFIQDLYPLIPKDIEIIIAGKFPAKELVSSLSQLSNVNLIPNPKDISNIICQGSIFLCPARLGSGIKVRISDGLKIGLPVIAHETSCRGYEEFINHGYMLPFASKTEFSQALNNTINNLKNKKYNPLVISKLYLKITSEDNFIAKMSLLLK